MGKYNQPYSNGQYGGGLGGGGAWNQGMANQGMGLGGAGGSWQQGPMNSRTWVPNGGFNSILSRLVPPDPDAYLNTPTAMPAVDEAAVYGGGTPTPKFILPEDKAGYVPPSSGGGGDPFQGGGGNPFQGNKGKVRMRNLEKLNASPNSNSELSSALRRESSDG